LEGRVITQLYIYFFLLGLSSPLISVPLGCLHYGHKVCIINSTGIWSTHRSYITVYKIHYLVMCGLPTGGSSTSTLTCVVVWLQECLNMSPHVVFFAGPLIGHYTMCRGLIFNFYLIGGAHFFGHYKSLLISDYYFLGMRHRHLSCI
jgi:hypothetical protein